MHRTWTGFLALMTVAGAAGAFGYEGDVGASQALSLPGNAPAECAPSGCASVSARTVYLVAVDETRTHATACTANAGAPGTTQQASYGSGSGESVGAHSEDGACVSIDGSEPSVAAWSNGGTQAAVQGAPALGLGRASNLRWELTEARAQAGIAALADGTPQAVGDAAARTAYDFPSTNACLRSAGANGILVGFLGLHPADCPPPL